MIKYFFYIIIIVMLFSLCKKKGKNNENSCNGNTRREVKICTDDLSSLIDTFRINTTIKELGELTVPDKVKSETTRLGLELKTYIITAKVDKLKKERDGDYHLRMVDEEGNYLICESANPGCEYASQSRFLTQIKEVRAFIEDNHLEGKTITITGVAFVDIDHGYKRKQAKNNIELHPILKISF